MPPQTVRRPQRGQTGATPRPVMSFTRYDRVSSLMIAVFAGLLITVAVIVVQWMAIRRVPPPPLELVPLEMDFSGNFEDIGGGFEDGNLEDTEFVDSPPDGDPNAAPGWAQGEQEEVAQMLDTVVQVSSRATQQAQEGLALVPTGRPGATGGGGRGGRPLGSGPGNKGGVAAHLRWHIRFDEASLAEYARQLEFFRIELALFDRGTGRVTYLNNLTADKPGTRTVDTWNDDRTYFKWSGSAREQVDRQFFQKAGVTGSGEILHFYPDPLCNMLVSIEVAHAKRDLREVRRTYFVVQPQGQGYTFAVSRQTYLR